MLPPAHDLGRRSRRLPSLLRASCRFVLGAVLLAGCTSSAGSGPPEGTVGPAAASDGGGRAGSPVESPVESPVAEEAPVAAAQDVPEAAVLRSWDAARGRAFAAGDVAALRGLYVAGSPAGTSDVRLLRAYLRRGLRVEDMSMQVLALQVLHAGDRRLRLRVTDRLAEAVAVGREGRWPLPRDRASTRVVELRRVAGEWRVRSVRE